ncbi:MAG: NTP transferase domain-containing protein [Candidatus Omnitrophica bacterium]|nr:NTP transferase domain-containing protein [Candidatus Omnitrophota bacterium]
MVLGIIPARGGSEGLPRKNIKKINGKPLIWWTIRAAKRSSELDDIVVSTDDPEIAETARASGVDVIERPENLATSKATTLSAMQHVLSKRHADTVVLLQPTSPIRSDGLIDGCVRKFRSSGADSLATGFICKYKEYGTNTLPRQEIEGFFYDDGNVYVMKADMVKKGDRYGKKIERFFTSREENMEIDDEFDFFLVENALKRFLERK